VRNDDSIIAIYEDAANGEVRLRISKLRRKGRDNFPAAVVEHRAVLNVVIRNVGVE
jgi:hypothetical protein